MNMRILNEVGDFSSLTSPLPRDWSRGIKNQFLFAIISKVKTKTGLCTVVGCVVTLSVHCHSYLSNMDFTFIDLPSLGGVETWFYLLRVPWQCSSTDIKEEISAYERI
jgi:hypothetical protein